MTISVAVLVDTGSNPFEFACALEIFGGQRRAELGFEPYTARVVTPERSVPMRDGLFSLSGGASLNELDTVHTIVVPNRPDVGTRTRTATLSALQRAHARGARLIGMCTGAFTLAEAGLLDARPATVHWQLADEFRRRFPTVDLQADVLYVDDGDILTAAGSAAAMDLALHVVRRDHGSTVANFVSRRLVFSGFRAGGQRQFIDQPVPAQADNGTVSMITDWARQHIAEPITIARLAAQAHTSPATLHRQFRAELGMTPLTWLTGERANLARRLLESDTTDLDSIARRSGLGTATNLRAVIRKHAGLTPSAYRRAFTSPEPALSRSTSLGDQPQTKQLDTKDRR